MEPKVAQKDVQKERLSTARVGLGVLIVFLAIAYSAGIVSGRIPKDHKIETGDLAVIVFALLGVALLLSPRAFVETIKHMSVTVGNLKWEMDRVKEQQEVQNWRLEGMHSILLPLFLSEPEQNHLLNLHERKTDYPAPIGVLGSELRRLRDLGLIRMRHGRMVRQIETGNAPFDLHDYVKLTDRGELWAGIIKSKQEEEKSRDVQAEAKV